MKMRFALACAMALASGAWAQYVETEPNETKAQASPVIDLRDGSTIRGVTTGSSTAEGITSQDTFRVRTLALASNAIYRVRLVLTSQTEGHTMTIRGRSQSVGVINPTSDVALQTSSASTSPARLVQWYSFGRMEEVFVRVTGTDQTTAEYVISCQITVVPAVDITPTAGLAPGTITITARGMGHSTDTDLWVYNLNLEAMPDYGNDNTSAAVGGSSSLQSTLVREFQPGVHYLALSAFNLANNLPSPPDDGLRNAAVTDSADVVVSSTTLNAPNLAYQFRDSDGPRNFAASGQGAYDVRWYRFTVGALICPADWNMDGTVDFNDYLAFLNDYFIEDARADLDGSGNVDFNDYLAFLNLYNAGC